MALEQEEFFISAVTIAARLTAAIEDVRTISLQTMNAQSVINRGGEALRPIRPVVSTMNTISTELDGLVREVNGMSLQISRLSLSEFLEQLAANRFDRAASLGGDAAHIGSIDEPHRAVSGQLEALRAGLREELQHLGEALTAIQSAMLSLEIVMSSLRLEVGKLDDTHKVGFTSLIERFETATARIRDAAEDCRKRLQAQDSIQGRP